MAARKKGQEKAGEAKIEVPEGTIIDEQENTVQAAAAAQSNRPRHPGPWVKCSKADILKHSKIGNLIGHDPRIDEVILIAEPKSIKDVVINENEPFEPIQGLRP